jgi:preprotein translocase SecE subunit
VADETSKSKTKRRIRPSTSETIREKATKDREKREKEYEKLPSKWSVFWYGFFWPLRMIAKPFKWFFQLRAVRWVGRHVFPRYFRNSWRELRQVTWPSRRESRQLTTAVIIFSVIFGVLIAGVDYGLDKAFKEIFIK